jgi:tRNA G18 (ribose-2'-O)-methylase SpoU
VLSVLASSETLETMASEIPEGAVCLSADKETLDAWVGFAFHRGVMAAVAVPPEAPESVLLEARRLLVLPQVDNGENLGVLLRSAAALGMDAVLVGRGPEVFERRAVRVSMGAAWLVPVFHREDPWPLLQTWRSLHPGAECVGAALSSSAVEAATWHPASHCALLLGPEAHGLDTDSLARCDRLVRIPMHRGVDSLNVASAGAILMHRMVNP